MVWDSAKPAGTDSLKNSDDNLRANFTEIELRRLDNLIKNGTFTSRSAGTSSVADGWALEGTPTVAYDTVDTGYGDNAVKLTASGAADEGQKFTLTNLKVSTKYQVFARVKVDAGDTASLKTTGATTNIDVDSTSTSYEDIIGEFITDGSATNVVLKLLSSADGDVSYWCGITVLEGDIPPANSIRPIIDFIPWQAWVPTLTGDADLSAYNTARFCLYGKTCFFVFQADNKTVDTAGAMIQITLPYTAANVGLTTPATGQINDGVAWMGQSCVEVVTNTNYVRVYKTAARGGWAGDETGVYIRIRGFYEIA